MKELLSWSLQIIVTIRRRADSRTGLLPRKIIQSKRRRTTTRTTLFRFRSVTKGITTSNTGFDIALLKNRKADVSKRSKASITTSLQQNPQAVEAFASFVNCGMNG